MHDMVQKQALADAPAFVAEFKRSFDVTDIPWATARWDAYVVDLRKQGAYLTRDDERACVPLYCMVLATETTRLSTEKTS